MKKKFKVFFLLIIFIISLSVVIQLHTAVVQVSFSHQKDQSDSISTIARQVTVRLVGEYVSGSGVIISHQKKNNIYHVLTCGHVLDGNFQNKDFQVITFDGKSYLAEKKQEIKLDGLDLAVVKFEANSSYDVATINQKKLNNNIVYAAGFPNLKYNQGDWENTFQLGVEHYQFNEGKIEIRLPQAMEGGYELGLTNEVEQGMSGGPLFNQKSELIGIVGRSKYGVGGINAYKFVDGSYPSREMLAQMESLSWAIPVQKITNKLPIEKLN